MEKTYVSLLLLVAILSVFVWITRGQPTSLFVDCGSNSTVFVDGRNWVGDVVPSSNNFTLSSPGYVAATSLPEGGTPYAELYRTARIFNTSSNYTFNLNTSGYYIRLHFYPFVFDTINGNDSIFDVTANGIKLIVRYNISDEIQRRNSHLQSLGANSTSGFLLKEYFLNITSNQLLIGFTPKPGSFAFVNAIEIIPVLDNSFFTVAGKVGEPGTDIPLNLVDRALETMYRLNAGGPVIQPKDDGTLWRNWQSDAIYMTSLNAASTIKNSSNISYADSNSTLVAPLLVYEDARVASSSSVMDMRFNMSWNFSVDQNFDYLIRLHFCELQYTSSGQRVFRIYINYRAAASNYDVLAQGGGENKAYAKDFIDTVPDQATTLWLQLGPDASSSAAGSDAILNGLEIFKVSRNGNLAHAPYNKDSAEVVAANGRRSKHVWVAVGACIAVLLVLLGVSSIYYFCKGKEKTAPDKNIPPGWRSLMDTMGSTVNAKAAKSLFSMGNDRVGGRRFSLTEIKTATKNFDESLVIGTGGFGKVYKGEIDTDQTVAIKRAHPQSQQGLAEFETEIAMLSKLRHKHLVSMIGYCDEQNEMILVYEYMANGTLRSHLFGSDLPPLSWKQRLNACIGAARGLHYLHTGAERGIIHRDVKTTNILLDENFVAKMADFGLSKTGPALEHTHVSTAVRGSFGYLDPEYFRRQKLTKKSDVYSFGVVLFEVVCARPVINPTLPKDQINLADWALRCQQQGLLPSIVDPRLESSYSLDSLQRFGEIAAKCLADEGQNRPTIGDVLWNLENVLRLHEKCTEEGDGEDVANGKLRCKEFSPSKSSIKIDSSSRPALDSIEEQCILSKES